jgi:hypothetical protein
MATLSAQTTAVSGTAITFSAASGGGDKFANSGNERLLVRNDDASSVTVTIDSPGTCNFGAAADSNHDLVVTVAAGAEKWIGPFSQDRFNDSNGFVNITYSGVTSLTVAVVRR